MGCAPRLAGLAATLALALAAGPCAPSTRPLRGWNSWSAYGNANTEALTLAAAEYVAEHLAGFGYDLVVVDGGWWGKDITDGNGLPMPNLTTFPSAADGHGLRALSRAVRAKGLRFGAWDIRGLPLAGVENRLPIAGAPGLTLADAASYTHNCSWDANVLGTNAPSAAASAWYASLARHYSAMELQFIKIDCMFPGKAGGVEYDGDVAAFAEAFSTLAPAVTISWSPGDGVSLQNGSYIASFGGAYGVAYRVTADFHDVNGVGRLQQQLDTAVRFAPLIGVNGTFPDLDMLPFGRQAPTGQPCQYNTDEQRFIMTLWAIARSPLILGAQLPLDANDTWTLGLVTNAAVLAVNAASCGNAPTQVLNADAAQLAAWSATAEGDGSVTVFALFNLREVAASVAVAVPAAAPGQGARCVTDLWSGAAEGPLDADGTLTRAVNAHGGGMWAVGPC